MTAPASIGIKSTVNLIMPCGKRRRKSWSRDDHKCRRNAARRRREQESDEARAARLQDQRARTKRKRERETGEERHARLQKDKERQRKRRERETEEKRHARLQEQRERTKRRRYEETEEERAARLQKDRERHRMRRRAETEKKREDPPENLWQREISAVVAEHNACLRQQSVNREKTKPNAQRVWCNISAEVGAMAKVCPHCRAGLTTFLSEDDPTSHRVVRFILSLSRYIHLLVFNIICLQYLTYLGV